MSLASLNNNYDFGNQGLFIAEVGTRRSEEPFVSLEGRYQIRERGVIFGGIASSDEREGRFLGGFRDNRFIIRIPFRDRGITIFGRFTSFENYEFEGGWLLRGFNVYGWISGSLIPNNYFLLIGLSIHY